MNKDPMRSAGEQPEPSPGPLEPFEDIPETEIKGPSNYYGQLWIMSEDGIGYWSIENHDGHTWHICPPKVFQALVEEFVK